MKVGIPRETAAGERRVAAVPRTVGKWVKDGLEVLVETGAGEGALFPDSEYADAGATILDSAKTVAEQSDVIVKVAAPSGEGGAGEIGLLRAGQVLVAVLQPLTRHELIGKLADAGLTGFSLDCIPRITRAQTMDVLSSQATVAGYAAVLEAARAMRKMVPMMMTAAGTIKPARALIIGAGVAGLQAIATAKRLGAVVTVIDVRPAVAEQVESLGARFVPMEVSHEAETAGGYAADLGEDFYRKEQEIIAPHTASADMVITTAMIPGRAAPILITGKMVEQMKPGSVIVDLAAVMGGNCALSMPDRPVVSHEVTILAPTNLAGELPVHASEMFSANVAAFLGELVSDGRLHIDVDNEIVSATLITRDGKVVHEATRKAMNADREQSC